MKIEYLRIKNFKTFKDVEMRDIPNFCVIVGANGSGKTTLFRVFGFLKEALSTNVHTALLKEGGINGFDEVKSRNVKENIEIELKFRRGGMEKGEKNPLITYSVIIGKDEYNRGIVEREILRVRRARHGRYGQPYKCLDFSKGKGKAIANEKDVLEKEARPKRTDEELKAPNLLAVKGLAQFEKFPAAVALGKLIESWHLSDIHIDQAMREQDAGIAEHLSPSGGNLSLVIDYFHKNFPDELKKITENLKMRVPGIVDVKTQIIETGQMLLKIKDKSFKKPFLVDHVSHGTAKMLAYLVLLYDPNPHPLLCVEEPENQLYHALLGELAEEFRAYAYRGEQVFVSTHSPDFLNAVEMEEVFFLIKKDGYTTIAPAAKDKQIKAYMRDGDRMGHLWREGFFDGVAP